MGDSRGPRTSDEPEGLTALLLVQQLVHYLLAVAEIRALELSEGIRKVDQAAPCCQTKDTECTRNIEPFAERDNGSLTLINQDEISVERQRECDGGSFPGS